MQQNLGYVLSALLFIFLIVLIVVAAAGGSAEGDRSIGDDAAINAASDTGANASPNVDVFVPANGEVTAASASASADNPCGESIALGDNDTLFQIAQRCDTSVAAILASNPNIGDVTRIPIGQTIRLPAPNESPAAAAPATNANVNAASVIAGNTTTYVIQPGNTLSSLARQRGITLSALLALNPDITNPDSVRVGQTIVLPTQ